MAKFSESGLNAQFIKAWAYTLDLQDDKNDPSHLQKTFSELCTELKFLYVAITRPNNRLFIIDEHISARKAIEEIWSRIGAVQFVTKDEVKEQIMAKKAAQNGD